MWPDHRLQKLFAIEHPIIQAPMAGSSTLELAIAVSAAGGLGSVPCAVLDTQGLRRTLSAARDAALPLNMNFFAHDDPAPPGAAWLARLSPLFGEYGVAAPTRLSAGPIRRFDEAACRLVEEFRPEIVSFHFGLPEADLMRRVRNSGAVIISSATTVGEARSLASRGCDAIIAQGYEAGGHRGMFQTRDIQSQMGTLALVPQIVDAVDVPVIAAGGIADGRGIAAALALGASGVQIGTAYLLSDESGIGDIYRHALLSGDPPLTALTNVFSGRPTRCIVNRAVRELGPMAADAPSFPLGFSAMAPLKAAAETLGAGDFSAHYCGQAASLGREAGAAALTRSLAADAKARIVWLAAGQARETGSAG